MRTFLFILSICLAVSSLYFQSVFAISSINDLVWFQFSVMLVAIVLMFIDFFEGVSELEKNIKIILYIAATVFTVLFAVGIFYFLVIYRNADSIIISYVISWVLFSCLCLITFPVRLYKTILWAEEK